MYFYFSFASTIRILHNKKIYAKYHSAKQKLKEIKLIHSSQTVGDAIVI